MTRPQLYDFESEKAAIASILLRGIESLEKAKARIADCEGQR